MSRRLNRQRDQTQYRDVLVRLKCPRGHVVGYLYRSADASAPIVLLNERRQGTGATAQ